VTAPPAPCTALVVGAGPVGLTAAAHLHRQGLACRLIDKSPNPSDKSKALVIWGRSLEMLDDLGVVGDFLGAGMLLKGARIHGGRRLLVHITLDPPGTEYPRPVMLAQSETERLLTEHLRRVGVAVERPVELTDFADRGDHVAATLRHADGQDEQVRCDWLVGCDGAHSTTRNKLGVEFTGEAEPNDWVLADCRIEGIPHDEMSLFWHARGVLAFFPFAEGRCRVIADMGRAAGAGHPPDPSLAQVQAIVDERGPGGVRLSEPHWLAGFRIHERKVADYRRGRVFLAGDAAHIHSPAGGQGMNTGMQDAYNLAWKLALVQAGRARPSLLDSYSAERGEVGERVLRAAARLTLVATLRNPVGQFLRNRAAGLLGLLPPFRRAFVRNLTEMAIHYPHSPLNGEQRGARGFALGGLEPGDRVPDVRLREPGMGREQRLQKVLPGVSYHLLLLPAGVNPDALAALHAIGRRAEDAYPGTVRAHLIVVDESLPADTVPAEGGGLGSVWLDPAGSVRRLLGAREAALAVVRPDGYLGYRGQPASWEGLRKYLDRYLIAKES
jgi:2-polyprenyl-6-methoxyphenol hydroxylase-like FAD-dependent oxidoreductase